MVDIAIGSASVTTVDDGDPGSRHRARNRHPDGPSAGDVPSLLRRMTDSDGPHKDWVHASLVAASLACRLLEAGAWKRSSRVKT